MPETAQFFAADGALARAIPGYRVRPQQIEMAERIAAAIQSHGVLVAEAGTGTGKTFAYLVPALMAGGKVIISTGTKTLQDQLFQRDLPMVRDALKAPATVALLKGRANYVCHYHLERARQEGRFLSRAEAGHILAIARFAKATSTGDKAECAAVPEDSGAWMAATSTRDNCLGQECPNARECFVMAARREAQAADVVVVNHHLFFADVMLRDSGVAELLPACNTVIFDEAHQLPETASLFFGENVSTAQLLDLARDARMEGLAAAKDFAELPEGARALEKAARDLRLAISGENARFSAAQLPPAFHEALKANQGWLSEKVEGPNIANVFKRTFYQMMLKFQIGTQARCAGCALALPESRVRVLLGSPGGTHRSSAQQRWTCDQGMCVRYGSSAKSR